MNDFPAFMKDLLIPKGTLHSGIVIAGTGTIHAFGGKRVQTSR